MEALKIHTDPLDRYSIHKPREFIRHLTMIKLSHQVIGPRSLTYRNLGAAVVFCICSHK